MDHPADPPPGVTNCESLRTLTEFTRGEQYLSEIASNMGIGRALDKVHLKKL